MWPHRVVYEYLTLRIQVSNGGIHAIILPLERKDDC